MNIYVSLSEVAEINPRPPKDVDITQEVSFLPMAAVSEDGYVAFEEKRILSDVKKGFTYFERGDFLIAKITPCFENGKATLTCDIERPIGYGSTEFHVVRAISSKLDKRYLYHLLWSEQFRFFGEKEMRGAAGQKRISTDFLKDYKIPFPPLEEQKRIAAILDKADAVRRKRQQAIDLTDQLLRSVFLDMFGDPETNPKGIELAPMTEIFHITTGKLNSNAAVEDGRYPFFTCAKEVFAIDTCAFDQEALLLAGNNAQAVYDVKHYIGKFNAYQRTYVLTLKNEKWSYPFYQFALEYQLENLKRFSKGSNTKYITMEIMGRTMLPLASPEQQLDFVNRVDVGRSLKNTYLQHRKLADSNFTSLVQRFFRGELIDQTKAA